jgi:ankyrin repeat protein
MEKLIETGSIQSLLDYIKVNPNWKEHRNDQGESFLHLGVRNNTPALVKLLISLGHDLNTPNNEGNTALHIGCSEGFYDLVSILLHSGANTNICNIYKEFPIHKAIECNFLSIVSELLNFNASLSVKNSEGESLLHLAIDLNLIEIAETLVMLNSELDTQDCDGNQPVHKACRSNSIKILKALISKKVQLDKPNHNNDTPLALCIKYNSTECLYYLIDTGILIRQDDVKLAREVSKPSIWEYISSIYEDQSDFYIEYNNIQKFYYIDQQYTTDINTYNVTKLQNIVPGLQEDQINNIETVKKIDKLIGIEEAFQIQLGNCIGRGRYGEVYWII